MSIIKCVLLVATTEMPPFVPAGTIARFEVAVPVGAFSVDDPGCGDPCGQALRKPSGPFGNAVKFSAYACALAGIPHGPEDTWKLRADIGGQRRACEGSRTHAGIGEPARRQRVEGQAWRAASRNEVSIDVHDYMSRMAGANWLLRRSHLPARSRHWL